MSILEKEFFFTFTAAFISVFFLTYLIYGRIKKKPLIGVYKPGEPGYDIFIRLVNNTKYLIFDIVFAILTLVKLFFDTLSVLLDSPSKAVLVFAPILTIVASYIIIKKLPAVIRKDIKGGK